MKDYREDFFKTECIKCYGHCDRNQRLQNEITTCYEEYLEQQNQAKDKVIENQKELLSECIEFLYNDGLIDRIAKRQ